MRKIIATTLITIGLSLSYSVLASQYASVPDKVINFANILKLPHQDFKVRKLPGTRLYEIGFTGGIIFITPNAHYIFEGGDLNDAQAGKSRNRECNAKTVERILSNIPSDLMITYEPKGKNKTEVYVFLDLSCPHCQDFNRNLLPKLLKSGIKVHYVPFPLGDTESASAFAAALCSKFPAETLQKAFKGEQLKGGEKCLDKVKKAREYGYKMQVGGIPAIFSKSGQQLSHRDLIRTLANTPSK